jgi:hypothetical protein
MTFKTQPHRYTIDLAPTSRARCRGCRQWIDKGALRLVIHAFVKPNRGTVFMRHLTPECVGPALAADVARARSAGHNGVCVDDAVGARAVACVWEELEASSERPSQRRGGKRKLEDEVRRPTQPIISTMLRHLGGVEVGGGEQKEDA